MTPARVGVPVVLCRQVVPESLQNGFEVVVRTGFTTSTRVTAKVSAWKKQLLVGVANMSAEGRRGMAETFPCKEGLYEQIGR